jgi:Domain of unknown function (DUF4292)
LTHWLLRRANSTHHPRSILFFLGILVLEFTGCTTVVPPVPKPQPTWQSAQLLASLTERDQRFRSVRALAQVEYDGPEGKHGFQEAILVQRPDELRLETLTLLGAILIVTANAKEIIGFHPREGVFVRGERTKENLRRYTQIPLDLEDVTQLLLGLPPVEPSVSWKKEGNALIFAPNGSKRDVVAFESERAAPTKWERFNSDGKLELSAAFSDYISTSAGLFPTQIRFEAHLQKKTLKIRYQDPEINPSLTADLFSQQKPPYAQEVPIEAIGS